MSAPKSLFSAAPSRFLTRDECEAIAKKVLSYAKADETSVGINSGVTNNTRFAVNQVSTSGDSYDAVVSVRSNARRDVGFSICTSVPHQKRISGSDRRCGVPNSRAIRAAADNRESHCAIIRHRLSLIRWRIFQ